MFRGGTFYEDICLMFLHLVVFKLIRQQETFTVILFPNAYSFRNPYRPIDEAEYFQPSIDWPLVCGHKKLIQHWIYLHDPTS